MKRNICMFFRVNIASEVTFSSIKTQKKKRGQFKLPRFFSQKLVVESTSLELLLILQREIPRIY
jgi:hypothetical protein